MISLSNKQIISDQMKIIKPHRANLLLQILLHYNVYLSALWTICHLSYLLFWNILWSYDGAVTILASITECGRLNAGYSINLGVTGTIMGSTLCMVLTTFILIPLLLYIHLVSDFRAIPLKCLSTAQCGFIVLEVLVALISYTIHCMRHKDLPPAKKPIQRQQQTTIRSAMGKYF